MALPGFGGAAGSILTGLTAVAMFSLQLAYAHGPMEARHPTPPGRKRNVLRTFRGLTADQTKITPTTVASCRSCTSAKGCSTVSEQAIT